MSFINEIGSMRVHWMDKIESVFDLTLSLTWRARRISMENIRKNGKSFSILLLHLICLLFHHIFALFHISTFFISFVGFSYGWLWLLKENILWMAERKRISMEILKYRNHWHWLLLRNLKNGAVNLRWFCKIKEEE